MAVQTKVLAEGLAGAAGLHVCYTVPAGQTAILKDLRAFLFDDPSEVFTVSVRSGPRDVFISSSPGPAGGIFYLATWIVLAPGDQIVHGRGVGGGFHFRYSGTELDGVA